MADIPKLMTRDEIRDEVMGIARENLPEDTNLNSPGLTRWWLETLIEGAFWLHRFCWAVIQMVFAASAQGGWLDLHGQDVNRPRKGALTAEGTVTFGREGTDGNTAIPSGTQVGTKTDSQGRRYLYETTAEAVIADGETSAAAPVRALGAGSGYNAGTGRITEIITPVPGVDSVTNGEDWLTAEGSDEEDTEPYRTRILGVWQALASGTTAEAYRQAALAIPGVVSAFVDGEHPRGHGTVDVYIVGAAGIPTEGLVAAVTEALQAIRPVNDDLLVLGPTAVPVDGEVQLVTLPGRAYAGLQTEAETILDAFFELNGSLEPPLRPQEVGEDFVRTRLAMEWLRRLPLKDVVFLGPPANVTLAPGELAVRGEWTLTVTEAAQP